MNLTEKRFTLVVAGLTTAVALRRVGIPPCSRPRPRPVRSALAANAIKAFRWPGIADEVMAAGRLLDSFTIYDQRGEVITRTDSRAVSERYGRDNFAIHRAALHRVLRANPADDQLITGKKAVRFKAEKNGVTVQFEDGTAYQTDYLLVADGLHSALRQQLRPAGPATRVTRVGGPLSTAPAWTSATPPQPGGRRAAWAWCRWRATSFTGLRASMARPTTPDSAGSRQPTSPTSSRATSNPSARCWPVLTPKTCFGTTSPT